MKGLNEFPQDVWPDNIELLYYAFHVMAGLGTLFILIMVVAALSSSGAATLTAAGAMLWVLMLAFPFPYIATTAGLDDARSSGASPGWSTVCCAPRTARARPCTPARRSSR